MEEQEAILAELIEGGPMHLVTGSAGTGKSTVLQELSSRLHAQTNYHPIVLAPSGVTAVNIKGVIPNEKLRTRHINSFWAASKAVSKTA